MPYYHGSNIRLDIGVVLVPRGIEYEADWGHTDFYAPLERWRPEGYLPHKDAIFLVADTDDIDLAGGGTEWIFEVDPKGAISKHDSNWSSEISCLMGDGHDIESDQVRQAAENYWNGAPHPNESVWEYICSAGQIVAVDTYDNFQPVQPRI